jgi:hypothetical protein
MKFTLLIIFIVVALLVLLRPRVAPNFVNAELVMIDVAIPFGDKLEPRDFL